MKTKTKAPAKATNNNDDDDDWAVAAMARDSLVVHLLLRLKHQASRPWAGKLVADLAPAGWGVRQPRSGLKSVGLVSECHRKSKELIGRRCSPSTPLSWSGGSGGGGGGVGMDGCETSSLPANRSPSSRSKISLTGSEVNGASSSKSKKKKTYAELKEEEDLLIKERKHLHYELAMLGATVKEQRAENENLKRIKLKLSTQLLKNNPHTAAGIGEPPPNVTLSMKAVMRAEGHDSALIPFGRPDVIPAQKRAHLMLPDLNMMPSDMELN